jgi:hypothetical protein
MAKVVTLAPAGAGSYEVRLLRFSAIALMALWLKPDAGGADIIYPMDPAPGAAGRTSVFGERLHNGDRAAGTEAGAGAKIDAVTKKAVPRVSRPSAHSGTAHQIRVA